MLTTRLKSDPSERHYCQYRQMTEEGLWYSITWWS